MILRRITIQSFGALEHFEYNFEERLNILKSYYTDEIARAICLVLGHKYSSLPEYLARRNSLIEAFVCVEGKEFRIEIKNKSSNLCLRAYDEDGNDLTKEYLYLTEITLCPMSSLKKKKTSWTISQRITICLADNNRKSLR